MELCSKFVSLKSRYDTMVYNRCGNSGLKLPAVSLGLWHNFGSRDNYENMREMCFTAFNNGITHFDLANNYGPVYGSAETNFGRILKNDLMPYRDELIISTKAGYDMWPGPYGNGGSRKYLLSSLDQSLKRLNVDYVDVFYHHCMDKDTPLEESMSALNTAVKSGKALYAGISNYDAETAAKAVKILQDLNCPFVLNQNSYNIFNRTIEKNGLKDFLYQKGIGLIVYSPLAQGLLSGRYLNGIPADSRAGKNDKFLKPADVSAEKLEKIKQLNKLAKNRGQSLAQMSLSWLLHDDKVTSVLIGASKPEQILENIGILNNMKFSSDELNEIDRISCS